MHELPAIHQRSDAGDPPERAREVRHVAVTQSMCNIGHIHAGVL